jgi:hypothetical protein
MEKQLLYVIGIPGSGKSALLAEFVKGHRCFTADEPFAHTVYEMGGMPVVMLGRNRKGRAGTDALSMSVQPKVVAALEAGAWPYVIGEGDRLANVGFFDAAAGAGYHVDVCLLDTAPGLAELRREQRGDAQAQNESWVKGRITKVAALAERATIVLDGARPLAELANELAVQWGDRAPEGMTQ